MKRVSNPQSFFNVQSATNDLNILGRIKRTLRLNLIPYKKFEVKKQQWDNQYSSGHWEYLSGLNELGRYSLISGYSNYYFNNNDAKILDVGCGTGVLQQYLRRSGYQKYLGVDISSEAINEANQFTDDKTEFLSCNVEDYIAEDKFDIIVFNECLYYFDSPLEILKKYNQYLTPNGKCIISMYGDDDAVVNCWNMISDINEEDCQMITNKSGIYWIIKVYDSNFMN